MSDVALLGPKIESLRTELNEARSETAAALATATTKKANTEDVYTKVEIDDVLAKQQKKSLALVSDLQHKLDEQGRLKANADDVHKKEHLDSMLQLKADNAGVHSKDQINQLFLAK